MVNQSIVDLGKALTEALGLPSNVTKLVLTIEGGKPPVVECTYFASRNGENGKLREMVGRFKLVDLDE